MTRLALRLVIFDCDGVLIDSEGLSRTVLAEEATRLGWPMQPDEARRFTGLRWSDIMPAYEQATGRTLPDTWPLDIQDRLIARMRDALDPVPGAVDTLRATSALGLPWRVASNSSHEEMAEKFARTGLAPLVHGRLHSARDVGEGKPSPALFLAAAAAEGVLPGACIVVEDSAPGIAAAQAAGMRCIAYVPEGETPPRGSNSCQIVRSLAELPPLFRAAMMDQAA